MERLTHKSRNEVGYKANRGVPLWKCLDKLGHLEDLQEQGRLPELPCAVGDTVYEVQQIRKRIQPYEVISVTISRAGRIYGWKLKDGKGVYIRTDGFSDSDFGKTVFLTYEKAEEALRKMEDRKNEID